MLSSWCPSGSIRPALALVSVLGLSGCDFVYLHYSDCGYYDSPRFDTVSLNPPILNQTYSDRIFVTFDNDWHIDGYDYRFYFSGSLPAGLTYYQDENSVYFEGAAISQGSYSFTVSVEARYAIRDRSYYYNSEYCSYRTTQNFLLVVEPY